MIRQMTPRQRIIQMIDLVSSPFSDQVNVTPEPWLASFKIWDPARRKHPPPTTKHHVQVPSCTSPHLTWDRISQDIQRDLLTNCLAISRQEVGSKPSSATFMSVIQSREATWLLKKIDTESFERETIHDPQCVSPNP